MEGASVGRRGAGGGCGGLQMRGGSGVQVQLVDSNAKEAVYSPGGRRSALLDVTVLRPDSRGAGLACVERNVLTSAQVKEFLVSLHKQRLERDDILPGLFDSGEERRGEAIVQIATHRPPPAPRHQVASVSQDGPPPCDATARQRRRPAALAEPGREREQRKQVTRARASDHSQDKRKGYLSDIRRTVDPLFVGLKESLRNVEARITAMQENIEPPPAQCYMTHLERQLVQRHAEGEQVAAAVEQMETPAGPGRTQHVYRSTPAGEGGLGTGVGQLKFPLLCHTKYGDGPGRPCLCQHCGMVSLFSEQQKYPIVSHAPDPKELLRKPRQERPKSPPPVATASGGDDDKYMAYLHNLAERVKVLEERLHVQEERAVPRDYFKRVITKIVSHFSARTARLQNELPAMKAQGADAVAGNRRGRRVYAWPAKDTDCCQQFHQDSTFTSTPFTHNFRYVPQSTMAAAAAAAAYGSGGGVANGGEVEVEVEEEVVTVERDATPPTTMTEDGGSSEEAGAAKRRPAAFWKWGEEILRPGIDLKNKIVSLLEVTLRKLRSNSGPQAAVTEAGPVTAEGADVKERGGGRRSCRREGGRRRRRKSRNRGEYCYTGRDIADIYPFFEPDEGRGLPRPRPMPMEERERPMSAGGGGEGGGETGHRVRRSLIPRPVSGRQQQGGRGVDVAYLNPNISAWREESSGGSGRLDPPDDGSRTNTDISREAERKEFLRALGNTRDGDRQRLWQSIWSQAQLNGQTKTDKVTIQIPKPPHSQSYHPHQNHPHYQQNHQNHPHHQQNHHHQQQQQQQQQQSECHQLPADVIELEFTIADLEAMLMGGK